LHSRHDWNTSTAPPITLGHAPSLRRPRPDRLDDPDRLVTGNEGEPARQCAGVLLVVGSAQPAGLHPQQRVVLADPREWKFTDREAGRGSSNTNARATV
jgi:hypothetical protein